MRYLKRMFILTMALAMVLMMMPAAASAGTYGYSERGAAAMSAAATDRAHAFSNRGAAAASAEPVAVTITPKITRTGSKAEALLSDDEIMNAIKDYQTAEKERETASGQSAEPGKIVIDASTYGIYTDKTRIKVPIGLLQNIVDTTDASLMLKTDGLQITIDHKALDNVFTNFVDDSGKVVVTFEIDDLGYADTVGADDESMSRTFSVAMKIDSWYVTSLYTGKMSIKADINSSLASADPAAVRITKKGFVYSASGSMDVGASGADGSSFTITAGRLSTFQIMSGTDAAKAAAATQARIKAGVRSLTLKARCVSFLAGTMQIAWIKTGDWKVDYYQVFRAKSGGHFSSTPIYTTSGDIRYYINSKGLASGQTYCYKIRGIRVLNGVKVYTRWSNVVSAKVQ